ncbi:hypothetical protein [Georgenia yuyongxinii]
MFGCKPAPSIKLATNTEMYERMREHGPHLRAQRRRRGHAGGARHGDLGEIIAVVSGEQTVSEERDLGKDEIVPWQLGTVT